MNNTTPDNGTIFLIPTPIGNLEDITLRSLKILQDVDVIFCEDTRTTSILLNRYHITTSRKSLHEHNEERRTPHLIEELKKGLTIALVSDAGTPLQSDPGYYLVREAIKNHITIKALPGANAAITGLILSGLPPYPYLFMGFLPSKKNARQTLLTQLQTLPTHSKVSPTLVFYESPKRLNETLVDMCHIFGEKHHGYVGRELTKKFEENQRGSLSYLCDYFQTHKPRGEIVIALAPQINSKPSIEDIRHMLPKLIEENSLKQASNIIAKATGLSKRDIYQYALTHQLQKK